MVACRIVYPLISVRIRDSPQMIKVGDIVLHELSGLYYQCENKKMERWMNMNKYYNLVDKSNVPPGYFINSAKR